MQTARWNLHIEVPEPVLPLRRLPWYRLGPAVCTGWEPESTRSVRRITRNLAAIPALSACPELSKSLILSVSRSTLSGILFRWRVLVCSLPALVYFVHAGRRCGLLRIIGHRGPRMPRAEGLGGRGLGLGVLCSRHKSVHQALGNKHKAPRYWPSTKRPASAAA